ncbi:MAG: MotA/TolQ/ExbB proton channel family protein [Thiotrichales bacterium]|jgi:biopolymer transport protein ExbB|nr:MotA/TolQ/ExbB proton channel family protein [Thiotrichales bacterium]
MTTQFTNFWQSSDTVIHSVFWVLVLMSLASWTIILYKSWELSQLRMRAARVMQDFWHAEDWQSGMIKLATLPAYALLAQAGEKGQQWVQSQKQSQHQLADGLPASELLVQALRGGLNQANSRLEAGQTMLASIGSTAPFVGLFGTVWGIYHALMTISGSQQIALDQIAGPVGEALIMTALGLFVAIPAVLAYNGFNRQLRLVSSELDGFAHDLHLYFVSKLRQG